MNARRAIAITLGSACGIALAVLCWLGWYVRYRADDFRTASIIVQLGFWKSQTWWYERWSGRFAYAFTIGLLEKIGPGITPVMVTITIAAWVIATYELLRRLRVPYPLALALTFVFAGADGGPDVLQSILWQTGLVTYVLPIAGLTAWLATTVRRESVRWYDVLVPLVLAGFSEANTLTQIAIAGALAITFAAQRKIFLTSLGASLVALAIVGAAPGNHARMWDSPQRSVQWIAGDTLAQTFDFFRHELVHGGWTLLLVFLTATLLAVRPTARVVAAAAAVAIGSAAVTAFAVAVTLRTPPSPRTLTVPHIALVAAIAIAGAAVPIPGRFVAFAAAAVAALTAVGPLYTAADQARDIPEASRFAHAWDRLDGQLRQCHGCEVIVADVPGNPGSVLYITHDPDNWPNRVIADYYGLNAIAAAPAQTSGLPKLIEDLPMNPAEGPRRHHHDNVVRLRFASD